MNNLLPNYLQLLLLSFLQGTDRFWLSTKRLTIPVWSAGVLAAIMFSGCGDVSTSNSATTSKPIAAVESANSSPKTCSTPIALAEQSDEPTAPSTQEDSPGLMDKAGKLLNSAKQASGEQVAETGQWLKGAWNGASDTTGNAVDGSLDWANQTYKNLKDQGLTTASSTGQWLSDDWQNMESWQYKVLATDSVPADQLEEKLNELGKQGWECFSIDKQRMIFKKAAESYLRRLPFKDILRLAPLLKQAN